MVICIEKKSDHEYEIKIDVKPNSNQQRVVVDDNYILIDLKSKPIKNKANKELLKLLKKKLKVSTNQLQLIAGQTSRNKIIRIYYDDKKTQDEILADLMS